MYVDRVDAKIIFDFITNEDHPRLIQHLRLSPVPIDIMSMRDHRKFTVITYSAYKNETNCFKILYEYAIRKNIDPNLPYSSKI